MSNASMLKFLVNENSAERKLIKERTYHPEVNYYSIDWQDEENCRWVRNNFQTLEDFFHRYGLAGYAKGKSAFQTAKDFRVLPEKWLSEPRQNWNEEIKSYVPDFLTNRQFIFDNRYEDYAVLLTSEQSLGQLTEDKETPEEWLERIKEDPRMKKMFLKKGIEGGYVHSDGEYAHLSLVDGKWVSDKKEEN